MAEFSPLTSNWVIDKVPVDVWRSIFQFAVAQTPFTTNSAQIALSLTHVCSSWRSIAQRAPELWTVVQVELPEAENETSFPNADLLSLILRNSGTLPLTLELLAEKTSESFPSKGEVDKSVSLFILQIYRSRVLRLSLWVLEDLMSSAEKELLAEIIGMGITHGAPLLKELELDMQDLTGHSSFYTALFASLWRHSPMLDTLVLRDRTDRLLNLERLQFAGCPFDQLVCLEVKGSIDVNSFTMVISSALCLQIAKFHRIKGSTPVEEKPVILLPALQVLHMGGKAGCFFLGGDSDDDSDHDGDEDTSCPPLTELLALLKAPSLIELRLHRDRRFSLPSFQAFIQHSDCKLEHLRLEVEHSDPRDGLECLRLLPSLRSLDLSTTFAMESDDPNLMSDELVEEMLKWDATTQRFDLCPDLEKITIDHESLRNYPSDGLFSEMVEGRWKRYSRNFEVVVKGFSMSRHDDLELFKDTIRLLVLKRDGLNLTLTPYHWLQEVICRK